MITWMQKHKKWLIVTIWISTIAFVGAGFVGWGSYDYGKSNSTVAIVGDQEIPLADLQNEYSSLYSQYQQMFGESFNKELAKQLKLEEAALQRVINKHLFINYATDMGLMVTDEEIAKEIIKIPSFQKDGKFDKNTYLSVLKQNRRSASEFEAILKQDLLTQKIQNILNVSLTTNEIQNISKLMYIQDKVSIAIIDSKNIKIDTKESLIKNYWSQNKDNYKSDNGYKISYTKIDTVDIKTKKEMKKIALKKYLKLKKGTEKFITTTVIYDSSTIFSPNNIIKIKNMKKDETLKPIYDNNNYYIVKLLGNVSPEPLEYNDIASIAKNDFINFEKDKILKVKIDNLVKDFIGKDIGYINRDNLPKIQGFTNDEISKLVEKILSSTSKIDFITLNNKTIVFNITDSKFGNYDKKGDNDIVSTIGSLKTNLLSSSLLNELKNKYEVTTFMGE